jgi:hypothetical protein
MISIESPTAAKLVAELGLARMEEEHVRQELNSVFAKGTGMRRAVDAAGLILKAMPDQAKQAMLKRLPRQIASVLEEWSREMALKPGADASNALVDVLLGDWNSATNHN